MYAVIRSEVRTGELIRVRRAQCPVMPAEILAAKVVLHFHNFVLLSVTDFGGKKEARKLEITWRKKPDMNQERERLFSFLSSTNTSLTSKLMEELMERRMSEEYSMVRIMVLL